MKIKKLFPVLVSILFLGGCVGSNQPVTRSDAVQIINTLPSKTFEVSRSELIVRPFPDIENREAFNFVCPVIMDAPTQRVPGQLEPQFMKGLAELVHGDLGISVDYQKLDRNLDYKITKKAGFVTDPELYWPLAVEKVRTGKQCIEIYTKVLDSSQGLDPQGLQFQTFIRIKNGSRLLKEYQIQAGVHSDVTRSEFREKLSDYLMHIPELIRLHVTNIYISKTGVEADIKMIQESFGKHQVQQSLPKQDQPKTQAEAPAVDNGGTTQKSGPGAILLDVTGMGEEE